MDAPEFVAAIQKHVRQQAVNGLVKTFTSPAGRKPRDALVKIAEWRARMADDEKALLDEVVAESVRVALFGLFAVIDGSRAVDPNVERFIIESVSQQGVKVEINADPNIDLHSEFAPD